MMHGQQDFKNKIHVYIQLLCQCA